MKREPLSFWAVVIILITVLAALFISAVPLGVGSGAMPWPNFTICVIFFWLVHRPLSLPTLAVVFVGLAHDLVGGRQLGSGMLALLICSLFLRPASEALDRSAFVMRWLAFAGFAAGVFLLEWGLTALPRWSWPPISAAFAQYLVTVLAYAPVSVLFRRVLRIGRT